MRPETLQCPDSICQLCCAKGSPPAPAAGGLQGDLIDQANADAEAELQIRLHQTDDRLLRTIEEALGWIRQGTYGICSSAISLSLGARLEAVPWSRHCRDCKEHEQSNGAAEGRS